MLVTLEASLDISVFTLELASLDISVFAVVPL